MEGFPESKMIDNPNIMTIISSYLNRKKKWTVRTLNRDFYTLVMPQYMVALRIYKNDFVEND